MKFFLSDDIRAKATFETFPLTAGQLDDEGPRKGIYRNLFYFGYNGKETLVIVQSYRKGSSRCDYYFGTIAGDLRVPAQLPAPEGFFKARYDKAVSLITRKNRVAKYDLEKVISNCL